MVVGPSAAAFFHGGDSARLRDDGFDGVDDEALWVSSTRRRLDGRSSCRGSLKGVVVAVVAAAVEVVAVVAAAEATAGSADGDDSGASAGAALASGISTDGCVFWASDTAAAGSTKSGGGVGVRGRESESGDVDSRKACKSSCSSADAKSGIIGGFVTFGSVWGGVEGGC